MAQERISAYIEEAERVLDGMSLPEERKTVLHQWAEQLLGRNK